MYGGFLSDVALNVRVGISWVSFRYLGRLLRA